MALRDAGANFATSFTRVPDVAAWMDGGQQAIDNLRQKSIKDSTSHLRLKRRESTHENDTGSWPSFSLTTGCVTSTVDEMVFNEPLAGIGDSTVVILGRRHASDYETEPDFIECVGDHIFPQRQQHQRDKRDRLSSTRCTRGSSRAPPRCDPEDITAFACSRTLLPNACWS